VKGVPDCRQEAQKWLLLPPPDGSALMDEIIEFDKAVSADANLTPLLFP
jgi:hypothetical protein